MDINNNTLINIFTKGMNTDTSDMLLSPELYREAVNLRLSTNKGGNDGELHVIEGTVLFSNRLNIRNGYTFDKILKLDSIRDITVAIVRYIQDGITTEYGTDVYKWAVITIDNDANSSVVTSMIDCNLKWGSNLSTVLNWESDENIYMYIADGENPILKVNLNGDSTQTYDDMVSYQGYDLDPLGIQESLETGELIAGKVQYTYRIYNQHSTVSQLSPISNVLSIYKNNNSGYAEGKKTSRAVLINIPHLTNSYGECRIQIFRIHYISFELPPLITMIYDGKLTTDTYIDRGTESINTLSLAEYTSLKTNLIVKPKVIESKDNYLYCANVSGTISAFRYTEDINNIIANLQNYLRIYTQLGNSKKLVNSNQNKSLYFRPGETYCFGCVFYDNYGNKSDVIKISEVTIDDTYSYFTADSEGIYFEPTEVFAETQYERDLKDAGISKIEIVRAERDVSHMRTLSLGICGWTLKNRSSSNIHGDRRTPNVFLTTNKFSIEYDNQGLNLQDGLSNAVTTGSTTGDELLLLQFASPEICYLENFYDSLLLYLDSLQIKEDYRILPLLFGYDDENANFIGPGTNKLQDKPVVVKILNGAIHYQYSTCYQAWMVDHNLSMNTHERVFINIMKPFIFPNNAQYPLSSPINKSSFQSGVINDLKYIKSPEFNKFSNSGEDIRIEDDAVVIGKCEFIPWTNQDYCYEDISTRNNIISQLKNGSSSSNPPHYFPISTCGTCVLLDVSNYPVCTNMNLPLVISVANIYKTPAQYSQYSKYLSFGDVIDVTGEDHSYILSSGDTFALIFEYNNAHVVYDNTYSHMNTACTIYQVPILSYVDMSAEYGTSFTKEGENYKIQDKACAYLDYVQDKSCYLYNPVYGDIDLVNHSFEKYEDEAEITSRDATIYVSLKKENGEIIDNWLLFKPADFLDLSYKYGQITDLATFNNQLIAWQEDAVALISTNERQLVNSTTDTEIVLGNGGPLARYDYITTKYGMKENLFCHAKSNTGLYWWDYDRRELLAYGGGQQVVPLTTINNLRNYINSGSNNDSPYLMYDHKYKELLASIINTNSLVYNEAILAFTGIYTFLLGENTEVEGNIYLAKDSSIYQWNQSDNGKCKLYDVPATPSLTYIVNKMPQQVKVYDNAIIGGSIYGNSTLVESTMDNTLPIRLGSTDINEQDLRWQLDKTYHENTFDNVSMKFKTPLNQSAEVTLKDVVTINEYDFRLAVPRNRQTDKNDVPYGNRMRGKTMECTIKSSDNSTDFSLQYIITKYRISWS